MCYSQVLGTRELIENGNFSDSLKGYTTEYNQFNKQHLPFEMTWLITKNPNTADPKFATLFDHTKDSKAYMLFVNGDSSSLGDKYFLSTQINNLETKFNYRFSFWLAYNSSNASSSIRLMMNNAKYGANIIIDNTTKCKWIRYDFDYYADNVSNVIKLYNDGKAAIGNDFAIDDLSFRRICDFPPKIDVDTIRICRADHQKINVILNVPRENLQLQWSPSNDIDISDTLNPIFTGANSGMYYLTVTDNHGCSLTDSVYVKVFDYPNVTAITAESEGLLCPCKPIKLSVPPGYTYNWSTAEKSNEIIVSEPGRYSVDIFNEIGCVSKLSIDVKNIIPDFTIAIDSVSKSIGEKFDLPISIIANNYNAIKSCGIVNHKISLSYYKSLLLPDSLSKYVLSSTFDTETLSVELPIYDSISTKMIGFTAALGSSACTELHIASLSNCPEIIPQIQSGKFCLNNICTEPNDRLVKLNVEESLSRPYPNPVFGDAEIQFSTPEKGFCELSLYNVLGELVSKLYSSYTEPGKHQIRINSKDYSSGLYIYELITPSSSLRKMMIIQ